MTKCGQRLRFAIGAALLVGAALLLVACRTPEAPPLVADSETAPAMDGGWLDDGGLGSSRPPCAPNMDPASGLLPTNRPAKGGEDSVDVVVIVFSSFVCPHCARLAEVIDGLPTAALYSFRLPDFRSFNEIQINAMFNLYMLHKKAKTWINGNHPADRFIRAFPAAVKKSIADRPEEFAESEWDGELQIRDAFCKLFLEMFYRYFGFLEADPHLGQANAPFGTRWS